MRILLIDDVRLPSYVQGTYGIDLEATAEWHVAKNYEEGVSLLRQGGWDMLCLDHDLGNETAKTGYDVMCFLEENTQYLPKEIFIVSANPVGRKRMQQVIDKLYG